MELIIIKGPIASGKTTIAQLLHIGLDNTLLIEGATLAGTKKIIKKLKPNTIIIDELKFFKKKVIQYLQKIANVVRIINIEIYRKGKEGVINYEM